MTIGPCVRYRLYDDEPRLRIGLASSRRRRGPAWPVARPARRHATAGPSARSTQNRWSSVHTEPCHQIIARRGAAAASASPAHGHDLRALLAPTMPALTTPTANRAARSGGDWITKTSRRETCGPTTPTVATTSVTVATITTA